MFSAILGIFAPRRASKDLRDKVYELNDQNNQLKQRIVFLEASTANLQSSLLALITNCNNTMNDVAELQVILEAITMTGLDDPGYLN